MKLTELKSRVLGSIEYLDSHDHLNHYVDFIGDIIAYNEDTLKLALSIDYPEEAVVQIIDNLPYLDYDLRSVRGYGSPDGYLSVFLGLPKREVMLMDTYDIVGRERQIIAALPDEPIWVSSGILFYSDDRESLHAVWKEETIEQFVGSLDHDRL